MTRSAAEGLYRRLGAAAGVRYLALEPDPQSGDPVDPAAARLLPADLARRLGVIPVSADARVLTLAASEPDAEDAAATVRAITAGTSPSF